MKNKNFRMNWGKVLPLLFLLITAMLLTSSSALAADPLNYCMDTGNTCAANDFGSLIATVTKVYSGGCVDHDGLPETPLAVQLDFYVTLTAAVPTRYDIGSILALDGQPVLRDDYMTDSCTRGYLGGEGFSLTTVDDQTAWPYNNLFWDAEENGDTCGDIGRNDTAKIFFTGVYVGCVDNYPAPTGDGQIDLDICLLYDQQATDDCHNLLEATPPGSVAKCECEVINIPVSPTAITLESLQANSALPTGYLVGSAAVLGIALLVGVWLVWRQRMIAP